MAPGRKRCLLVPALVAASVWLGVGGLAVGQTGGAANSSEKAAQKEAAEKSAAKTGEKADEKGVNGRGGAATSDKLAPLRNAESPAERINGIRKLLEADRNRYDELTAELEELEAEFERASKDFEEVDARWSQANTARRESKAPVGELEAAELEKLATERVAARDRFDRVIARRKAAQQQLETLSEKIELEEMALERALKAEDEADPANDEKPTTGELPKPAGQSDAGQSPAENTDSQGAAAEAPETNEKKPSVAETILPGITQQATKSADPAGKAAAAPKSAEATDRFTAMARREVESKRRVLKLEQNNADLISRGIDVFERDLTSARRMLEELRREHEAVKQSLAKDSDVRNAEATRELESRLAELQEELDLQTGRVRESEEMLKRLQTAQDESAQRIKSAESELSAAERQAWFVESPLAPHRLYNWLVVAGPKILAIVVGMIGGWWLVRVLAKRIVSGLLWRSDRGTDFERQARADTLARVFQSAGGMVVLVLGTLAVLDQAGIEVTVLLGGAAVIGAAIAFGSQNLIRDYFSGFMILIENQYSVGNVVRIGQTSGVVEDISLRMTVLRDEEGVVHFIPHNQVTTVSNMTHGWSRAVFAIGVGYNEDVDRVMAILKNLAEELRQDENFGPHIIGSPEMQGVDALGQSAVVVKFLLKTRPLKQWAIKREMLRRIKKRFDAEGIEIPYRHQTIYYRDLGSDGGPAEQETAGKADAGGRE